MNVGRIGISALSISRSYRLELHVNQCGPKHLIQARFRLIQGHVIYRSSWRIVTEMSSAHDDRVTTTAVPVAAVEAVPPNVPVPLNSSFRA